MSNSREYEVHYGCHEVQEDAERVITGRVGDAVAQAYFSHLETCTLCNRYHQVLAALYVRPEEPRTPLGMAADREFAGILGRLGEHDGPRKQPAPQARPLHIRWLVPVAIGSLTATAAALALALVNPAPRGLELEDAQAELTAGAASAASSASRVLDHAQTIPDDVGGLEHRAQTFGRVIGGDGDLTLAERPVNSDIFSEGTHFAVDSGEAMQVGLMGKVLASFEPGTRGEWTSASSSLIELGIDKGMVAIRYDRKPADPVLQIRTPTAVVRVIGTVFTVAVGDDGRTIVSVLRGKVEIRHADDGRRIAEVEPGYRFDVASSTYADLGRPEVAAALPLAGDSVADIPTDWAVPGLGEGGALRTLAQVADPAASASSSSGVRGRRTAKRARPRKHVTEDLMANLIAETEDSRRREVRGALERCRDLYSAPETRFRAAQCLTRFMTRYGQQDDAVEGLLLVGILRMDFAHDYQSATLYFEDFLARAPEHPKAELARYKLVLASVESGKISDGLERAEDYLDKYPDGHHVGRILQRFPELKSRI